MSAGGMLLGLAIIMAGLNSLVVENNNFQNLQTTRRFSNLSLLAGLYHEAVRHVKGVQKRVEAIRLTGSAEGKLVEYSLQVFKDKEFKEKVSSSYSALSTRAEACCRWTRSTMLTQRWLLKRQTKHLHQAHIYSACCLS